MDSNRKQMHNMQAAWSLGDCLLSGHSRLNCFSATGKTVVLLQMYFDISSSEKPVYLSLCFGAHIFNTHPDAIHNTMDVILNSISGVTAHLQSGYCITWKTL